MRIRNQKDKIRTPYILIALVSLFLLLGMFFFTSPDSLLVVLVLFALVAVFVFSLAMSVFLNKKRSLVIASAVLTYLALSVLGLGNILNAMLVAGVAIALDRYANVRFN